MDNGGPRFGAGEGALRPPLPTATQSALQNPTILLGLRSPKIRPRLTDPSRRNIIAPIRGSERWVAGIKSESRPASDRNRWPASYWNWWPASSESASAAAIEAVSDTIEVIAPEPGSVSVIEMVAAKSVSVDTIEVATVEPTSGAKRKAKPKSKVVAAAPTVPVKRKPGRPRKATV